MTSKNKKHDESDLERRLCEAGLDQEEIDEEALRGFLKGNLPTNKTKKKSKNQKGFSAGMNYFRVKL